MPNAEQQDRWLTLAEAARYAGLSEDTMRNRIADIPGSGRTHGRTGDWRVKASMIARSTCRAMRGSRSAARAVSSMASSMRSSVTVCFCSPWT